jgi:hypothetical protein
LASAPLACLPACLPFGGFSILGFLSLLGSAAIFQAGDSDSPAASRSFLILGLQIILSSLSISRKYIMRLPIRHLKVPNSSIKMTEPSKVLHIRNVGPEISEHDLRQLAQSFGNAQKIVMLRAKNQALLQMQDVPSAINVMQYYSTVQPSVRGRNVYLQFSSHQELTTIDQPGQPRRVPVEQVRSFSL